MKISSDHDLAFTYCSLERNTAPEKALENIRQIIAAHELEIRVHFAGDTLRTYQVFLSNKKIKATFIGCGKGIGIQSEISALFEAFEHYMSYVSLHDHEKSVKLKVIENKDINHLMDVQILPANFVDLIGGSDVTLPWIKLSSLHNVDSSICYPLFLMDPYYCDTNKFVYDDSAYYNLSHLSSSSGYASGSCFEESIIHGLHESIERDAHSLFLYNGFIKKDIIKIVNKKTVPQYLQNYIELVEKKYNDELVIIDITSNTQVPCFCVTFTNYKAPIPPKGFGASLSKSYALERALLESLQPVHLRNEHLNQVERNTINRLSNYPLLQSAAIADIRQIIQEKRFVDTDFNDITDLYTNETLVEQKDKILLLLENQGFHAYFDELYTLDNYSLVYIKVSVFSNLHLLQTGKLILPNINCLNSRLNPCTRMSNA